MSDHSNPITSVRSRNKYQISNDYNFLTEMTRERAFSFNSMIFHKTSSDGIEDKIRDKREIEQKITKGGERQNYLIEFRNKAQRNLYNSIIGISQKEERNSRPTIKVNRRFVEVKNGSKTFYNDNLKENLNKSRLMPIPVKFKKNNNRTLSLNFNLHLNLKFDFGKNKVKNKPNCTLPLEPVVLKPDDIKTKTNAFDVKRKKTESLTQERKFFKVTKIDPKVSCRPQMPILNDKSKKYARNSLNKNDLANFPKDLVFHK